MKKEGNVEAKEGDTHELDETAPVLVSFPRDLDCQGWCQKLDIVRRVDR